MLQKRIMDDFYKSVKTRNKKEILGCIVGELQRQKSKNLTDDETIKILKVLRENEKELMKYQQTLTSEYLDMINEYLPEEPTKEEITNWIKDNIDFTKYKNKLAAIKDVSKHFGAIVDNELIKTIIINMNS